MKVQQISCGDDHTLAILTIPNEDENEENSQALFVWGSSSNQQLGLKDSEEDINVPHQIDPDPWNGLILQAQACHNYSAAVNTKGQAFSWGSGEFGRLGYPTNTKQQKVPRIIKGNLNGKHVVQISLGSFHVAAVTQEGEVFTWGYGINGQLGHNCILNEESPKKIVYFNDIVIKSVACGECHSLALGANGQVYSWGQNRYGQLEHPSQQRQNQPKLIESLKHIKITDISAGKKHNLALTKDKQIYAWGSNQYGQLGVNEEIISQFLTEQKQKQEFYEEDNDSFQTFSNQQGKKTNRLTISEYGKNMVFKSQLYEPNFLRDINSFKTPSQRKFLHTFVINLRISRK